MQSDDGFGCFSNIDHPNTYIKNWEKLKSYFLFERQDEKLKGHPKLLSHAMVFQLLATTKNNLLHMIQKIDIVISKLQ